MMMLSCQSSRDIRLLDKRKYTKGYHFRGFRSDSKSRIVDRREFEHGVNANRQKKENRFLLNRTRFTDAVIQLDKVSKSAISKQNPSNAQPNTEHYKYAPTSSNPYSKILNDSINVQTKTEQTEEEKKIGKLNTAGAIIAVISAIILYVGIIVEPTIVLLFPAIALVLFLIAFILFLLAAKRRKKLVDDSKPIQSEENSSDTIEESTESKSGLPDWSAFQIGMLCLLSGLVAAAAFIGAIGFVFAEILVLAFSLLLISIIASLVFGGLFLWLLVSIFY